MTDSDTQQIIRAYQRRLNILEQQRAGYGDLLVPPPILTEIDDIRTELSRLLVRDLAFSEHRPNQFPGLILLIGPGQLGRNPGEQSAKQAIDFHRGTLQYCWIITSPEAQPVASSVQAYCQGYNIHANIYSIPDAMSVQPTYDLVNRLYRIDIQQAGLNETDVIADLTGATKPMSFGMLLACGMRRPLQYMVRQPENRPSLPISLYYTLSDE